MQSAETGYIRFCDAKDSEMVNWSNWLYLASFKTITEKSADRINALSLALGKHFSMKEKLEIQVLKVTTGEKRFKSRSL